MNFQPQGRRVTIPFGESLPEGIFIGDNRHIGVMLPSVWETAGLSFQVSNDGTTWTNLYKDMGDEYTVAAAASRAVSLDPDVFAPWRFLKIRSGTAASAVAQNGVTAASKMFDFGGGRTLKFTSGVKGVPGNTISVEFDTAETDALDVSEDGNVITVKLSPITSSNNSASAIETAVQELSTVAEVDVSAMTVEESTAYAAARPARVSAATTVTVATGKTLTFDSKIYGPDGNAITVTMETAEDDTLDVSNPENTNTILIKAASTTASNNTAAAIETAIQTLSTIGEDALDVSAFTVTGNEAYNSAPLAGVKAGKEITVDTGKTLTFGSGVVGPEGNAVKITIGVNTDEMDHDTLSVTAADDTITILLADTTGTKNAATAIETAVRAITGGTVAGVDITGMTVAGNTAYTEAPVIALGEGITVEGVALEGGAVAIADGVVEDEPLTGGADIDLPASGALEGGEDTYLIVVLKE